MNKQSSSSGNRPNLSLVPKEKSISISSQDWEEVDIWTDLLAFFKEKLFLEKSLVQPVQKSSLS